MLSYGSLVWSHATKQAYIQTRLRSLQRMAINLMTHIPRSTPSQFLELAVDLCPLHIFFENEAMKAYYRLHKILDFGWSGTSDTKTYSESHMRQWKKCEEEIGLNIDLVDQNEGQIPRILYKVRK